MAYLASEWDIAIHSGNWHVFFILTRIPVMLSRDALQTNVFRYGAIMFSLTIFTLLSCISHPSTCDNAAAGSVNIRIVDESGTPLTPDSVSWSVDGGETVNAECVNAACSEWVAGWEVAGEITVVAELGSSKATAKTDIERGECHVVPYTVMLELTKEFECTGSVEPSVILKNMNVDGIPVNGVGGESHCLLLRS
jgi:hypothetical protein